MGLFNMSMFMGLSIGPLIGGQIRDHFSLDTSFASMGVLAFAGFLFSLFLLPPTRSESVVNRGIKPIEWKRLVYDSDMAGLFLFRLAYAACIGVIWSFLPVLGDLEFSLSSSSIGILVTLGIFSSGLLHVPMGFLADRLNRKMMVVAGGVIISYAIFSFAMGRTAIKDLVVASVLFGFRGRGFNARIDGTVGVKRKCNPGNGIRYGTFGNGAQYGNAHRITAGRFDDGSLPTPPGISIRRRHHDHLCGLVYCSHLS